MKTNTARHGQAHSNPRTQEAEEGGSCVLIQPGSHSKNLIPNKIRQKKYTKINNQPKSKQLPQTSKYNLTSVNIKHILALYIEI